MTRIAERKTKAQGETSANYRGRPLMVSLDAHCVLIRQKGKRTAFAVPYVAIYEAGAKLAAIEQRRDKAEARRLRMASSR